MKALKKIKLNHYADEQLKEREMNLLRGGGDDDEILCTCATDIDFNLEANTKGGYTSLSENVNCYQMVGEKIYPTVHKNLWP